MEERNIVRCPNCGTDIDVSEVLYRQIESEIKAHYQRDYLEKENRLKKREEEMEVERRKILEEKNRINQEVEERVGKRLKDETHRIEDELKKKIEAENREYIEDLIKELNEKQNQLKEFNRVQLELERVKREKEELRDRITLEKEKELNERLLIEKEKMEKWIEERSKSIEEKYMMETREKDLIISRLTSELEEANRRAQQGSIQLKGEAQEIELRELLKRLFPIDEIIDVKAGQKGADVIQIVKGFSGEVCGKIYYESKRTKEFKNEWIKKLKDDNLREKADILVIVTNTMPKDEERSFVFKDDVWICKFSEVEILSSTLRFMIQKLHSYMNIQRNKGSKMEMLYNYLAGEEFKAQFETIIRGYIDIKKGYEEERMKMLELWKRREKQLEKILDSASELYGAIKGIAGSTVPTINEFEMTDSKKALKSPTE